MALEQCLFVVRLTIYVCLWILSWMTWIPLCIIVDKHGGYCLLYADRTEYGPLAACGYTITVPIIFSLLYPCYMVVSYLYKINFYNKYGYIEETVVEFVITVVMDGLSWIFMFVHASLISAGFNDMCWSVFDTIEKCSEGYLKHPVFGVDSTFFQNFKISEVSGWLSWLLWLTQLVMGIMALSRSSILPQTALYASVLRVLPCRPQCSCSCRLNFNRPDQPQPQPPRQTPAATPSSPRKSMITTNV